MKKNSILVAFVLLPIASCSNHPPIPNYYKTLPAEVAQNPALAKALDTKQVDVDLLEWAIFYETNIRRQRLGLLPLRYENRLRQGSRAHSQEMEELKYFAHVSPVEENASVKKRFMNAGIKNGLGGENIAIHPVKKKQQIVFRLSSTAALSRYAWRNQGAPYTYREFAEDLLSRWLTSVPHRRNILSRGFRFLGVGVAPAVYGGTDVFYITQNFSSTNY